MHPGEWIALVSLILVLAGTGYKAVASLTRITVALEQLGKDIGAIVKRVDVHEQRISLLERNARGRHRVH
jgi:cell division protein FtsB